jgi:hypothetical protein
MDSARAAAHAIRRSRAQDAEVHDASAERVGLRAIRCLERRERARADP